MIGGFEFHIHSHVYVFFGQIVPDLTIWEMAFWLLITQSVNCHFAIIRHCVYVMQSQAPEQASKYNLGCLS